MLKKTIKFTDEFGNPAELDAYFNLTKAECIELNIRNDLEVVGRSRNQNEIMDTFQRILSLAYGVKRGDGKFLKLTDSGAPYFNEFKGTEAYSELFMEIWQDPEYAHVFIKEIMPAEFNVPEDAGSQSEVPGHMADHPSMQGHKKPETRREAKNLENFNTTPAAQPPAIATDPEYQEFLQYKAEREAAAIAPERVSPTPETPQQPVTPRDELI